MKISGAWLAAKPLQELLGCLNSGGQARIAGGAVRNGLLQMPVHEVDVATTHPPERVMELAKQAGFSVHPTGLAHGTVTVARAGVAYEVTTLRHDVETDGRRAKVAFTQDWEADARRRDFTMNALYADAAGEVFDTVQGIADLRAGLVRFVGEPEARIGEDYLRILRFFRFFAQFGQGAPDVAGLAACGVCKVGLLQLSPERVRQEMLKLLPAPRALAALRAMADVGVLPLLLPQADLAVFEAMADVDQDQGFAPDGLLRLAALAPAMDVKTQLRLSNAQVRRLEDMALAPPVSPAFRVRERRDVLYRVGAEAYADSVRLQWARMGGEPSAWLEVLGLADAWAVPVFPLQGGDLLALGFKPGPELGAMLQGLEDWWIASDFTASREDLLARVKEGNANG
jgi:poly(A) polymerase